jgi:transglutaminase-like putative cysteine protease
MRIQAGWNFRKGQMTVTRRQVSKAAAAVSATALLPRWAIAAPFVPATEAWRTFEITTRIEIANAQGPSQAWIPLPAVEEHSWTRPLGNKWTSNAKAIEERRVSKYGARVLQVGWAEGETSPIIEVTSRVMTRDRSVDLSKPGDAAPLSLPQRILYLQATELIPSDGIVKETANKITMGAASDLNKARRIYDWVVERTYRDPKVRGCGIGDVAAMLKTGNFGGKCADINALYVGLARAAGLPARDIYGIRLVPSKFGYKSLGANSEVISKSQHCRADVYLKGFGWVPVDPADVRKVALEEPPGNLPLSDMKVASARETLFGASEMNWLAYNFASDVALPGSSGPKLAYLMYPQAEIRSKRIDSLEPDTFKYVILAREIQV